MKTSPRAPWNGTALPLNAMALGKRMLSTIIDNILEVAVNVGDFNLNVEGDSPATHFSGYERRPGALALAP